MNWILAAGALGAEASVKMGTTDGKVELLSVGAIGAVATPKGSSSRRAFRGSWSEWTPGDAAPFLKRLRIPSNVQELNRQTVFQLETRLRTWHLPALVLFRAMCGKGRTVFPRAFRPALLESLSQIDYSGAAPHVTLLKDSPLSTTLSRTEEEFVSWAATSRTCRRAFAEFFRNCMAGSLSFSLPEGTVHFTATGTERKGHFFIGSLQLADVQVPAHDAVSGKEEAFQFHQKLQCTLKIPLNDLGAAGATNAEWAELADVVKEDRIYFDEVLCKYVYDLPWNSFELRPDLTLTQMKRHGSWSKVLEVLATTREGNPYYVKSGS